MDQRLKLTAEDIDQASPPSSSGNLRITPGDLPPEPRHVVQTAVVRITYDDLQTTTNQSAPRLNLLQLEQQMWQLINEARARQTLPRLFGTKQLRWHDGLATIARWHSQDMLNRNYIEHITPEGVTAGQRLRRAGITYFACGENIGVIHGANANDGQGVQEIHQAFMNQPRGRPNNHRGNILNPIWTHVGIGLATNSQGELFATQNYISTLI